MKTNAKAQAAYDAKLAELKKQAADIARMVAELEANNEPKHWGHVGDVDHYEAQLRNVTDSFFKRGEYAQ